MWDSDVLAVDFDGRVTARTPVIVAWPIWYARGSAVWSIDSRTLWQIASAPVTGMVPSRMLVPNRSAFASKICDGVLVVTSVAIHASLMMSDALMSQPMSCVK